VWFNHGRAVYSIPAWYMVNTTLPCETATATATQLKIRLVHFTYMFKILYNNNNIKETA
jgi:hypothetical protein